MGADGVGAIAIFLASRDSDFHTGAFAAFDGRSRISPRWKYPQATAIALQGASQSANCYHGGMACHRVAMMLLHDGTPRDLEAREQLAAVLPDAEVAEADELGVFEIALAADDQEHALQRVWDAVAASGTDDHIVFLEHPDLPGHWRHRSRRPDG